MAALADCADGVEESVSSQCFIALEKLLSSCHQSHQSQGREGQEIDLPYFGKVSIQPQNGPSLNNLLGDNGSVACEPPAFSQTLDDMFSLPAIFDDMMGQYEGSLLNETFLA